MTPMDIVGSLIVIGLVALAVYSLYYDKKHGKGCGGCSGGCSKCSGSSCNCNLIEIEEKK